MSHKKRSARTLSNAKRHTRPFGKENLERVRAAMNSGQWAEAERFAMRAVEAQQDCLWANRYLPFCIAQQGRIEDADEAFQNGLKNTNNDGEIRLNYVTWLLESGRPDRGLVIAESLAKDFPDSALSEGSIASACYYLGDYARGYKAAERALALSETPLQKSFSYQQLAIHSRELGQIKEAVAFCEKGLKINPDDLGHHTNRMLFMLANPDLNDDAFLEAGRAYAKSAEGPWKAEWPSFEHKNRDPSRRLKVGFLSPDFRNHSVTYFTEGLLARLNRSHFEVFALYLYPTGDATTERVKQHADHFFNFSGVSPEGLTKQLRELDLDIVVELTGHTGHNGLPVMARKVAPVQVSSLGFPGTTGLTAIDYRISDPFTDPPDGQRFYAEKLWRLNALFGVYRPCINNPLYRYQPAYSVRQTPALTKQYVTFGSCTNLGRLTDQVLTTWGKLLQACPNSRLLIEGKNLQLPSFANEYADRCESLGIPRDRLQLLGQDTRNQYLTYHDIDIVLDPFPLNSGTTSFDALWMGVPFVSITGTNFRSRIGTALLQALGFDQLIARNESEYIEAARLLASNTVQLNQLRMHLRKLMEASVLMNEGHYVHEFEKALRSMWFIWTNSDANLDEVLSNTLGAERTVAIAVGKRVPVEEAYLLLQELTDRAKQEAPVQLSKARIDNPAWLAVQGMAESILNSFSNDPVALACLAEIENAHGHTDFATSYLYYALEAMTPRTPTEARLPQLLD